MEKGRRQKQTSNAKVRICAVFISNVQMKIDTRVIVTHRHSDLDYYIRSMFVS